MAYDYTPNSANNPATIRLPNDGDAEDAASVTDPLEDLADKDSRKFDKISGGTITGGMTCEGSVVFDNSSSVTHNAGCTEEFDNTPFFQFGALCSGTWTFDGASTEIHFGPETHSGAVTFDTNALTCSAGLDVTGGLHSISGTILDGTTTCSAGGTVAIAGRLKTTGVGRLETRTYFGVGTNATQDITMAMGVQHIQAVLSGSDKTYTMKNTGCTGDETISIFNESAASFQLIIKQHDGTTTIVSLSTASGDFIGVELWNDGLGNAASSWHVKSATHKA